MAGEKILVVDDDFEIRQLLKILLRTRGYEPVTAANADEALALLRQQPFDLLLLDIMLPGGTDGLSLCRSIRQFSHVPIIMLTARGETYDKVIGLESGADDYVTKPFEREELLSRIRAMLRRSREYTREEVRRQPRLTVGPLEIDYESQEARLAGRELTLTNKEFLLLYTLARNVDRVLSREILLDHVWGDDVYGDNKTLDVHVYRLRKKLNAAANLGRMVVTVRGRGYKLIVPPR